MVSRRRVLNLGLAGVGSMLPGCVETNSRPRPDASTTAPASGSSHRPSSTTRTTVDLEVGEAATIDGEEITVAGPRVRRTVVLDYVAWVNVRAADGRQYLLVDVEGTGDASDPDAVHQCPMDVVLDGAVQTAAGGPWLVRDVPPAAEAHPERLPGDHLVALEVPTGRYASGAVAWAGRQRTVRWGLPDRTLDLVASAPDFELVSYELSVIEDAIALDLSVANRGDRDGLFVGKVSVSSGYDISNVVAFRVPVDDTVDRRFTPPILDHFVGTGADRVAVQFWSAGGRFERTVDLREAGTATPGTP